MSAVAECLARKSGWCVLCRCRWQVGDPIRKVERLRRWTHSTCGKSYELLIEENQEAAEPPAPVTGGHRSSMRMEDEAAQ